jgi:sugar lactone lactonase YvrE
MLRFASLLLLAGCLVVAAPRAEQGRAAGWQIRVGGTPLELVAARGSLWVLVCDRRCTGEARESVGRIVRIDPRRGRIVAWAALSRPGTLAVGPEGVFVTDFWHNRIRRIDPSSLRVVSRLELHLPFELAPGDSAFLPSSAAVGAGSVWVATRRGALVRVDLRLGRVQGTVRLPGHTTGAITFGEGSVWVAENVLGVYRVDTERNRVVARIRIGRVVEPLSVGRVVVGGDKVLALGVRTSGGTLTGRNAVARIDPGRNRVEGVTGLPPGPLATAFGNGALWVGRAGGSQLDLIDPRSGRLVRRYRVPVGTALAVANGDVWTATRDGIVRRVAPG